MPRWSPRADSRRMTDGVEGRDEALPGLEASTREQARAGGGAAADPAAREALAAAAPVLLKVRADQSGR